MKQRLVIALLAVLCFGAGFAARRLTEEGPAVPPPPATLGSEFARPPAAPAASDPKAAPARRANGGRGEQSPPNRAKLLADIERYRAQIEIYRKSIEALDAETDAKILATLTAEQREKFTARQKRFAERRARGEARDAADSTPLTDDQILRLQQGPLFNVLGSVAISMRLDGLSHDLKLDEAQQAKVRDLLRERREKFIALVDSIPPPSIMLSRLAPVAQKLAAEPHK